MIANLRSAATLVALFTLMLGLVYPLSLIHIFRAHET